MEPIAHIRTELKTKFGVPRQAGLVEELRAQIIFTPAYRNPDALRGLEGFSHIWLIWEFSETRRDTWSPTVRPPRLGGNVRMGVFATRSPFRPNAIGLSCVRLSDIGQDSQLGPVLTVCGADLMDGTPIFDIKPYIPYADCHPEATGGFTSDVDDGRLEVEMDEALLMQLPEQQRAALLGVLAHDPRPRYQHSAERVYGLEFGSFDVRFRVECQTLKVISLQLREKP